MSENDPDAHWRSESRNPGLGEFPCTTKFHVPFLLPRGQRPSWVGPSAFVSPTPPLSAALHAAGGSLPPVRLPDRHRAGCPLRRIAGRLDGDVQRPRAEARLPVQRRAAGRSAPGRAATSAASNSFTWNPMQQGTYEIQVVVKDGFSAREERVRDRDLHGADACRGDQRRGQPHGQPPGRPVQRTSLARHLDVRPVRPGRAPPCPGRIPRRCPSSPARAPTSSWPACCPTRPT